LKHILSVNYDQIKVVEGKSYETNLTLNFEFLFVSYCIKDKEFDQQQPNKANTSDTAVSLVTPRANPTNKNGNVISPRGSLTEPVVTNNNTPSLTIAKAKDNAFQVGKKGVSKQKSVAALMKDELNAKLKARAEATGGQKNPEGINESGKVSVGKNIAYPNENKKDLSPLMLYRDKINSEENNLDEFLKKMSYCYYIDYKNLSQLLLFEIDENTSYVVIQNNNHIDSFQINVQLTDETKDKHQIGSDTQDAKTKKMNFFSKAEKYLVNTDLGVFKSSKIQFYQSSSTDTKKLEHFSFGIYKLQQILFIDIPYNSKSGFEFLECKDISYYNTNNKGNCYNFEYVTSESEYYLRFIFNYKTVKRSIDVYNFFVESSFQIIIEDVTGISTKLNDFFDTFEKNKRFII
jgi:hypothetical protein